MERKYYDLTSAQKILFYSQKFTLHKQVNNVCTSVIFDAEIDFDILSKAVVKAYERNDSLSIRIVKIGKQMKQYFTEYEEPDIEYLDFRGKTFEAMEKYLYKIAHRRISVFGKPMSKVYLMHTFDGKCGIYFVVSHMILDSWGITTFYKDVIAIYEALSKGTDMPKPLASYEKLLIEELNYKNTEAYKKDREYWEEYFDPEDEPIYTHVSGSSVLEKYRAKKKSEALRYGSNFSIFTKADNVMLLFPKELVERMEAYCADKKVTMQSIVLLAYRSYFSKVNKRERDISIYSVVARRGTLAEKNAGGSRVHFMPFRTIFDENLTFRNACELICEKQLAIYRHAEIDPLEVMEIWRKIYNVPQIGGYIATNVTYQPVKLEAPNGMKLHTKWYGNGALGISLYLTVMDGDGTGALKFYYEYETHHVSSDTIKRLHEYMMRAIEEGISNDEITVGKLLNIE